MIEITYTSEAASSMAPDDIFNIIETSARNNLQDDLTGFLIFSKGRFFQLIEGPESSIDALFARLSNDPRHENVFILTRKEIKQRSFPKWQMKRLSSAAQSHTAQITGLSRAPAYVQAAVADFLKPATSARS